MPVILSRIHTRTGDADTTALDDNSRVRKTDPRLAAYADADETNAAIGVVIAPGGLDPVTRAVLEEVQSDLFDVGADLCAPIAPDVDTRLRIRPEDTARLETDRDAFDEQLDTLRSFVLSGGTAGAALSHQARTIARRAERSVWALLDTDTASAASLGIPATVDPETTRHLNRLSDLLFVPARSANRGPGLDDVLWEPGRNA